LFGVRDCESERARECGGGARESREESNYQPRFYFCLLFPHSDMVQKQLSSNKVHTTL